MKRLLVRHGVRAISLNELDMHYTMYVPKKKISRETRF